MKELALTMASSFPAISLINTVQQTTTATLLVSRALLEKESGAMMITSTARPRATMEQRGAMHTMITSSGGPSEAVRLFSSSLSSAAVVSVGAGEED